MLFFLRSLLRARIFGQGYTDVNNLTDDVIKNRLCNLVVGSKPVSFDDAWPMSSATFCLDVSEPHARLRILMLQTRYPRACASAWLDLRRKGSESRLKHLVAVWQPPVSSHE